MKNLDDYYERYVQSDNLLLADIFESFPCPYLERHNLDPFHFFLHQVWQRLITALKKDRN